MIEEATFFDEVRAANLQLEQTVELIPCPFCGGEAVARYALGAYRLTGIQISCTKCHVSTSPQLIGVGVMTKDRPGFHEITETEVLKNAAALWNKRTEAI